MFYSYPCVNICFMKKLYVLQLSLCQYVTCINEEVIMFHSYPCVNMLHVLMKKLYVSQLSMCQYVKCINEEVICFIAIHVSICYMYLKNMFHSYPVSICSCINEEVICLQLSMCHVLMKKLLCFIAIHVSICYMY